MAKDFASINVELWSDPDWRRLPWPAQHLYLTLWTSPSLSYCGVHDWRPGRLAALSDGFTADAIKEVADCLIARHFLVVDVETEEVLIRSWARFDGLLKKPRMAVSYSSAYASVASETLRSVLAHETRKIRDSLPNLSCWTDPRVAGILDHPATSAKDLPTPNDPFADGFAPGFSLGLPQTAARVSTRVYTPPTPAPAPAPYTFSPERSPDGDESAPKKRSPERPIPSDWKPSEKHAEIAKERGLDLDEQAFRFRNHAISNDRRQRNWNASFNTWLSKATDYAPPQPKVRNRGQMPEGW